jgi:hypothetical protein
MITIPASTSIAVIPYGPKEKGIIQVLVAERL